MKQPAQEGRKAIDWRWLGGLGLVAAAAVMTLVLAPWGELLPTPDTLYETVKGRSRAIQLADGSHVELDTNTHIAVRLDEEARRVTVRHGQALFDVARDPDRPFLITAGDQTARVVGAKVVVCRRDGQLSVMVLRGLADVWIDGVETPAPVRPGQLLVHREDGAGFVVQDVSAEDQLSWRSGRLVYRNQSLGRIVSDLNQYFEQPLRIEGERTANLKFTGVLIVDGQSQDVMIRRLSSLLPISATASGDSVILRARAQVSR